MERFIREGLPIAEVARRLGRSRQTIYNRLSEKETPKKEPRASKLDPHRSYIQNELEKYDLPATVLLEKLRKRGYTGGISILRTFVAQIKARQVQRVVDRFETDPGRQAQIDFASCGTIEHGGRRRRLSLVTLVLGYSRVIWAKFIVSERRPVLFECLEEAFREIGGVPQELLVDNCKQIVASARYRDTPAEIQTEFQGFADHFGFEVVACPAYWPRAKGKVERAILYLKRSFLEGRRFEDLDDLNAQLRVWLASVANVRVHGTVGERPCDRLARDVAEMLPVSQRSSYPRLLSAERHVAKDSRISFRGVQYSVDPEVLLTEKRPKVKVLVSTDHRIQIFYRQRIVGAHSLMPSGSPPQDDPRHASRRRQLCQKAPDSPPKSKAPRFDQAPAEQAHEWIGIEAPVVENRSLVVYEVHQ